MNDSLAPFSVEVARPEHVQELAALFARTGSTCFCRYWHFAGDKNAWLDRCANRATDSRSEMEQALGRATDQMRGVVAIHQRVIGWMKLAPAESLRKLYDQRLYRGLPCFQGDRAGVFTIGCFLVDEAWRRRGVAHALLDAGIAAARSWGARAIEAFPRRSELASAEELWTGAAGLFTKAGFAEVHDFAPYPVFRLNLTEKSGARAGCCFEPIAR